VLSREQQFVPYQIIYCLRPDIKQMVSGDTYDDRGNRRAKRLMCLLTGAYYRDPYLMYLADSMFYQSPSDYARVLELLFREPGMPKAHFDALPLTKLFPPPMGEMVARTGWQTGVGSPAAVVTMRIGETFFGNHQHKDFGTFQIYYRGALALSTGVYDDYGSDHWTSYYHQTVSKNGLLIHDPSEKQKRGAANDGGQRWPEGSDHPKNAAILQLPDYRMGTVTAHAFGPDPARPRYSYIEGDITGAYARQKASHVSRAMVTFNTGDEAYPCAFVVFDRVVAEQPQHKKTWLIHAIQEPEVEARRIVIVRDGKVFKSTESYAGKLVVHSLLPEEASLQKVGGPGREFWVESAQTNYAVDPDSDMEPGAWRVEVSATNAVASHLFLHAMVAMDAGSTREPVAHLVPGDAVVGARVLDRVAVFSRSGELLGAAAFTLSGEAACQVLVCNLLPGAWSVRQDGEEVYSLPVSEEGGCLFLECASGEYTLSRAVSTGSVDPAASDFDGSGQVGFPDFVAFAGGYGARAGDGRYEARYDLDASGYVGFSDFLLFAAAFGGVTSRG